LLGRSCDIDAQAFILSHLWGLVASWEDRTFGSRVSGSMSRSDCTASKREDPLLAPARRSGAWAAHDETV